MLTGYDPVAAVGTLALDHREFTVTVGQGGAVAVDFGAHRGKLPPIVNAVRVTHRPDLVEIGCRRPLPRFRLACRTAE